MNDNSPPPLSSEWLTKPTDLHRETLYVVCFCVKVNEYVKKTLVTIAENPPVSRLNEVHKTVCFEVHVLV